MRGGGAFELIPVKLQVRIGKRGAPVILLGGRPASAAARFVARAPGAVIRHRLPFRERAPEERGKPVAMVIVENEIFRIQISR